MKKKYLKLELQKLQAQQADMIALLKAQQRQLQRLETLVVEPRELKDGIIQRNLARFGGLT